MEGKEKATFSFHLEAEAIGSSELYARWTLWFADAPKYGGGLGPGSSILWPSR